MRKKKRVIESRDFSLGGGFFFSLGSKVARKKQWKKEQRYEQCVKMIGSWWGDGCWSRRRGFDLWVLVGGWSKKNESGERETEKKTISATSSSVKPGKAPVRMNLRIEEKKKKGLRVEQSVDCFLPIISEREHPHLIERMMSSVREVKKKNKKKPGSYLQRLPRGLHNRLQNQSYS